MSGTYNTVNDDGLVYDYDAFHVVSDVDLFVDMVPYLSIYTEYISNLELDEDSRGITLGTRFGDRYLNGYGTWQADISYRYLEENAWLDIFPDSDAYGGATGVEGLELALSIGVTSKSYLGLDIYQMDKQSEEKNQQTLIQLDYTIKL